MRINTLKVVTLVAFLFLSAGLWNCQVRRFSDYRELSENNRVRLVPIEAARGIIYDRSGARIVDNKPSFDVTLIPEELKDAEETLKVLSGLTGYTPDFFQQQIAKAKKKTPPFIPLVVVQNVEKKKAILIEERQSELPGVVVRVSPLRRYLLKEAAGHIVGYIGKIDKEQFSLLKEYGYRISDLVGKAGIEKVFDRTLRGTSGGMQIEVDNNGRVLRVLGVEEPRKGQDVHLTIDIRLQEFVHNLLEKRKGAIVCMEPYTGELLAMASSPGFDPNIFVSVKHDRRIGTMIKDEKNAPFLNRAISIYCAPGSIFKMVVAAAGLETKAVTPYSGLTCEGQYTIGDRAFKCWKVAGHGQIDIEKALLHSCNVFFYKLGLSVGADGIANYAGMFGLGKKTGVELPGERAGLVPTAEWKAAEKRKKWYKGDTANLSIGQGYILTTPIQAAMMVSVIANGGYLTKPRMVKGDTASSVSRRYCLSKSTIKTVKRGLEKAVSDRQGTAHNAYVEGIRAAAKTGTAQVGRGEPHGWIVGFAPVERPRLSFAVFLEHGGQGGGAASTLAADIVRFVKENPDL